MKVFPFLDKLVTYTTTERGYMMLLFKGYPFTKERCKDDKITWACRQKAALQ